MTAPLVPTRRGHVLRSLLFAVAVFAVLTGVASVAALALA
jgi:hypothetical protein